jgi:hypothetical protein
MPLGNVQHTVGGEQHVAPAVQHLAAPTQALTPSQRIIEDANRIEYTKDAFGRVLGVMRINAKLRVRVVKALSAGNGEKPQYLFMAMVACACVSIDGAPVQFPMSEIAVDALIFRLEQEGLDAVGECLAQNFPDASRQDIKN